MKTTVVPAQVTTVEDRIMGNLGFSQLILFIIPIFVGGGLFALLPPVMHGSLYKYLVVAILSLICAILAIRIRGKIILLWLITILRYNLRPKYYLFNKNTAALREQYETRPVKQTTSPARQKQAAPVAQLGLKEAAKVLAAIDNPAAKLRFEATKKGGLYVRLTEVKD